MRSAVLTPFLLVTVSLLWTASCEHPTLPSPEVQKNTACVIGVIPNGNDRFWKAVEYGTSQSAEKNGFLLNWAEMPSSISEKNQVAAMDRMVAERVNGIIIAPRDYFSLQSSVKKAQHAGIPILYLGKNIPSLEKNSPSVVTTDQFAAGRMAADEMAKQLGEKGKVAMIRYNPLSQATCDREEGFLEQMKNYPDIEVLDHNIYAGTDGMIAREKIENAFQICFHLTNSRIDGLFVSEEATACETLQAMKIDREATDCVFVAFGSASELVNGLQTYYVNALVMEQPAIMGRMAVDSMAKLLYDETLTHLIDSGAFLLTLENFDTPYAKAMTNFNLIEMIDSSLLPPPEEEDADETEPLVEGQVP